MFAIQTKTEHLGWTDDPQLLGHGLTESRNPTPLLLTDAELEQVLSCCQPRLTALEEMAAAMVQACSRGDSSWADVMDQRDSLASAMRKAHGALAGQNRTIPLLKP